MGISSSGQDEGFSVLKPGFDSPYPYTTAAWPESTRSAEVVEWQTRTLEVRMLTRLAGSSPVLGMKQPKPQSKPVRPYITVADGLFVIHF